MVPNENQLDLLIETTEKMITEKIVEKENALNETVKKIKEIELQILRKVLDKYNQMRFSYLN